MFNCKFIVSVVLASVMLLATGQAQSTTVDTHAFNKFTKEHWPNLYRTHGAARVGVASKLQHKAVEQVAKSGKCKHIESVGVSDRTTKGNFIFFVDCDNYTERFYVSEKDIASNSQVTSEQSKAWDERAAREKCREMILAQVKYRSSTDIHDFIGTSVWQGTTNANVVVEMNFDAKNDFGTEIPYVARCVFPPGKQGTIEINSR